MPAEKGEQHSFIYYSKEIIAGSVGGAARIPPGHPFDTVKVNMQTTTRFNGMIHAFTTLIRENGVRSLYRGAQSPIAGMAALNAAAYFSFAQGKAIFKFEEASMSVFDHYKLGLWSGFWTSLVEGPVDFFKCQLQMRPDSYRGFFHCAGSIIRTYGIRGAFQGFGPSTARNVPAYGGFFFAYEYMKREQIKWYGEPLGVIPTLIAGGCGGFMFWSTTYPIDVIKSAMQADHPDPAKRKYKNMYHCAKLLHAQAGGFGAFTQGIVPCLVRAFLANACAWAGYEYSQRAFEALGI